DLDGDDEVEAVDEQRASARVEALDGAGVAARALLLRAQRALQGEALAGLELVVVADPLDGGHERIAAAEQPHDLLGGGAQALELGAVEQTQVLGVRAAVSLPVGHRRGFIIPARACYFWRM